MPKTQTKKHRLALSNEGKELVRKAARSSKSECDRIYASSTPYVKHTNSGAYLVSVENMASRLIRRHHITQTAFEELVEELLGRCADQPQGCATGVNLLRREIYKEVRAQRGMGKRGR